MLYHEIPCTMDTPFIKKLKTKLDKQEKLTTAVEKARSIRSVYLHINRNMCAQYSVKDSRFWNTVDFTRKRLMNELLQVQQTANSNDSKYFKTVYRTLELYRSSYKKQMALSLNTALPGALCAKIMEFI